jgi:hypothetical protein
MDDFAFADCGSGMQRCQGLKFPQSAAASFLQMCRKAVLAMPTTTRNHKRARRLRATTVYRALTFLMTGHAARFGR